MILLAILPCFDRCHPFTSHSRQLTEPSDSLEHDKILAPIYAIRVAEIHFGKKGTTR